MNLESSRLKAFNSFLFFITLTMYFELFIFFKDLKNIFDGGHRWLTADWLINYNFGFVRRGMFGSFFINLPHEYSNILFLIEYVLFFIYLGTLFLFFYVSYQFIGTSTLSIFLLSPVFLKFIFFNQYAGFRKEMLCVTTIVLLVAYKKSDRKIFYVLSFLFYVLSVFSSEYGFMLFFPIFFLLLVKNNENVKTNIGFTIMPPLVYLILHIMNSDKYFQKSLELCQSIKKLNPFNYSNYICEGQIHWIGLSSVETINITKSYYDMQYILYYLIMFCVGLIPLVIATGAGAIGNRTIGSSAMGGMLIGTILGVLVIPGLYFVFAKMSDGRELIKDENTEPVSEEFMRTGEGERKTEMKLRRIDKLMKKLMKPKFF